MALPKAYRLVDRRAFERIYRQGRKYPGRCSIVRVLARTTDSECSTCDLPKSQFGIVTSKKVDKRAVVRNRIRRRIAEALFALLTRIQPGLWIVVSARSSAIQCSYAQFLQELEELLTEAGAIHGH